ncbi:hypothetical protein HYFRA_00012375 [Hymenoscyphus fraxineus]|uniref:Heterokaryon incompatibility domain-containing protein n=1 Tax=Hymenoscyphus fraxineus TaxID=746836 RepID=A0A9N9L867_9HELO|nr:hypothetical protein HYFRA_00012375 [Hymenoscyphus fraxineus]
MSPPQASASHKWASSQFIGGSKFTSSYNHGTHKSCCVCGHLRLPKKWVTTATYGRIIASASKNCWLCTVLPRAIDHFFGPTKTRIAHLVMEDDEIEIIRHTSTAEPLIIGVSFWSEGKQCYERLRCFAGEGSFDHFPKLSELSPDFTLSNVVDWALEKIEKCKSSHRLCRGGLESDQVPVLPSRVLDLSTTNDGEFDTIRLWETHGSSAKYIALSHCWGGVEITCKTTRTNIQQRMNDGFLVSELPLLFQQAVDVAKGLGVLYLWIDALCIVQDDIYDWEVEASLMANVYSNSFLTIAATRANNSLQGMLGTRNVAGFTGAVQPLEYHYIDNPNGPSIVAHRDFSGTAHRTMTEKGLNNAAHIKEGEPFGATSPLMGRAWVLQERVFSPRTLFLHFAELFLECDQCITCECGMASPNLRPTRRITSLSMHDIEEQWSLLVWRYSQLHLSNPSDKLPAFSGIASAFKDYFKDDYLAGIWKTENLDYFAAQLAWRVWRKGFGIQTKPGEHSAYRSVPYRAPTWSWASVDHKQNPEIPLRILPFHGSPPAAEGLQIARANCTVSGANPYGEVTSGYLEIRGKSTAANLCENRCSTGGQIPWHESWCLDILDKDTQCNLLSLDVALQLDQMDSDGFAFTTVHLLLILQDIGSRHDARAIVLIASKSSPASFERIGVADITGGYGNWPLCTFQIV